MDSRLAYGQISFNKGKAEKIGFHLVPNCSTINSVNSKHKRTLRDIYAKPIRAGIAWTDIEAMPIALGAEISEGNGSRVRIALKGIRAVFHRPHPQKETDKGAIASIKRLLQEAGIKP